MQIPRALAGLVVLVLLAAVPALRAGQASNPPASTQAYTFTGDAGMLFFHVRPERTVEFEAVVTRIGQVLDKADAPSRKAQGAAWRMYKSLESAADSAVYVFFFDPIVAGADYDPVKLLSEALPAEAQALYEQLRASVIKVERMGLSRRR